MVDWNTIAAELKSLAAEPSYVDVQRVGRRLLSITRDVDGPRGRARVALASSFTVDPLAAALAVECCRAGIAAQIHVDGFGTFGPHILDPSSALYAFDPELLFLSAELPSLVPGIETRSPDEVVEELATGVEELVAAWTGTSAAPLVLHDFAVPVDFPFEIAAPTEPPHAAANAWLHERFRDHPQVHVLAFDRLCSYHGKSRTVNPKLWLLGSMRIAESFMPLVARHYLAYIEAAKGLTRKCLVVDLDETLWGGIVGEDGFDGIGLATDGAGSEYLELQRRLLRLHERGILLAIASKNNPDEALAVLNEHPAMLLRPHHFAAIRLNWDDKGSNLRAIASELNIGLDALAFLDTNPVERAWVQAALPEVLVIETPDDPALVPRTLGELTEFETLALTEEDRQRAKLYAAEAERRDLAETTGDYDAFLRRLGIVLRIVLLAEGDVARVAQLTRKTNQFNMTARRYSDGEIAALDDDDDTQVYTLRYTDVFGDGGLVGVAIIRTELPVCEIDTFLLSCRVLGRRVEAAFLTEVLARQQRRGCTVVRASFVPTGKNASAQSFYSEFGFTVKHVTQQGVEFFELEFANWSPPPADWYRVASTVVGEEVAVADR